MHDLVIRSGRVVDGSGDPSRTADVAVSDGQIAEIGVDVGRGRREVDADGLVVAPGWVDIHTHYDGQALWDPDLTPSSWHGVTTVVTGNCGIGFAPVPHDGPEFLIELMEAVEDIPAETLRDGVDWDWSSFPEYLDALDRVSRSVDVAAQVPHVALRAAVMGARAHERASDADIASMAALTEEAMRAGASGVSTSRTVMHSSRHGYVPGTEASIEELFALGAAMRRAGHGMFQVNSDHKGGAADREWTVAFVEETGIPLSYVLSQTPRAPEAYRDALRAADEDRRAGIPIWPQISCRPAGVLYGFDSSLHPFIAHPTWRSLAELPVAEATRRLAAPSVRAALLSEESNVDDPRIRELAARGSWNRWDQLYRLGDPPDYEPPPESSVEAVARREGRRPEDVALDWMLERDGTALLFAPMSNYSDGNHDAILEMLTHPATVLGLSDAGAHCASICDASSPTYLLSHWVNGRTRGDRLSVEQAVALQTRRTAEVFGFRDRGLLAPGMRADLNLIDLENVGVGVPEMVRDLPAGGRRLVQQPTGYVGTFVKGVQTLADGELTGERPGRVVRF